MNSDPMNRDETGREPGSFSDASGPIDEGGAAKAAAGAAGAAPTPQGDAPNAGDHPQGGSTSSTNDGIHDMGAFEADVEDSDLAQAMVRIGELEDELARAKADMYNLNQEYGNYVRRSKEAASGHRESGQGEVIEALMGVLDDIDAARTHGDLGSGPFAAIASKLEETLSTRFGVERYGQAGDDFDPVIHEALMAMDSAEVDRPLVKQVLQPGYKMGDKVLRATKVMVENPL